MPRGTKPRRSGAEAQPVPAEPDADAAAARRRILEAAFVAVTSSGYAAASTLEIATRARVSKRELYALVGNKQAMLGACIQSRVRRFDVPAELPTPCDRASLAELLASFGARLVREVGDPTVVAVFRLAIAEAIHAPEVARTLDSIGRGTARSSLRKIMVDATSAGLVTGEPQELAAEFAALLWGDLMLSLLLGVTALPRPREIAKRARSAARAFLQLNAPPGSDQIATPGARNRSQRGTTSASDEGDARLALDHR
jgi:AcrR family transcriptional regulator